MKRKILFLLAVSMLLSACGKVTDDDKSSKKSAGGFLAGLYDSSEESSEPAKSGEKVSASAEVGYNGDDTVTRVELIPDESIDISDKVQFEDMYERHVLHTGVVGRVGAPVELDFDKNEVRGGTLVFTYDSEKLSGVRPDALMFLWYDEANDNYVEKEAESLDTDAHTVSLHITEPGTYLLVNMYTWLNVWGADLDDDGMEKDYDPSKLPLDTKLWEQNGYMGSLMEIADKEYLEENRQNESNYFEGSNAEELAAAICLINCGRPEACISIAADIDLAGLDWAPIGWDSMASDNRYSGVIEGNGHTISNMTINSDGDAGFISTASGAKINDLSFVNAQVSGNRSGVIIGYIGGLRCTLKNCSASGSVNGTIAGAIIGDGSNFDIPDCSADVTVNGEKSGYMYGRQEQVEQNLASHPAAEKIWLDENNKLHREAGLEKKYHNLGWVIKCDGVEQLSRNAENETELDLYAFIYEQGHYEVYLEAFDGGYIPISNVIEFDIP